MTLPSSVVLLLSGVELRRRLEQRGWPDRDAALLVECSRAGCPECSETIVEVLG